MSARLSVLDVGHGNCSVFREDKHVGIIDAGRGPYASIFIESSGITEIDLIVISHADDDHLAGVIGLLSSEKIKVNKIRLNADAMKDTKIWRDVRELLQSQHNQGKISVELGIFQGKLHWSGNDVSLDVLAPSIYNTLSGVGGKDESGKAITSNSGSVVLRVSHKGGKSVLLASDMEDQTLQNILDSGQDINASVLVFPHHGGRPGSGSVEDFTDRLIAAVKPSIILFSNGREKHDNPRPEIVSRACAQGVSYIACTQLSKNCHISPLKQQPGSLLFSAGADEGKSCAGTIEVNLESGQCHGGQTEAHKAFVNVLSSPMCRSTVVATAAANEIH